MMRPSRRSRCPFWLVAIALIAVVFLAVQLLDAGGHGGLEPKRRKGDEGAAQAPIEFERAAQAPIEFERAALPATLDDRSSAKNHQLPSYMRRPAIVDPIQPTQECLTSVLGNTGVFLLLALLGRPRSRALHGRFLLCFEIRGLVTLSLLLALAVLSL